MTRHKCRLAFVICATFSKYSLCCVGNSVAHVLCWNIGAGPGGDEGLIVVELQISSSGKNWGGDIRKRRPRETPLTRMHGDRSRTLDGDVAARDVDACPAGNFELDRLRCRPVDVGGGALHIDFVARLHRQRVGLCLHVDLALGGDHRQARARRTAAGLDGAGQYADGLAGVDPELIADGEVGVAAARPVDVFSVGPVQALAGRHADAGLGGGGDHGVGEMRQFLCRAGVLVGGVGSGLVEVFAVDHAGDAFDQGGHRCCLVVEHGLVGRRAALVAGELHGLVGAGGLAEGLDEVGGLFA